MWPGRQADHSLSNKAEVGSEWSATSTRLHAFMKRCCPRHTEDFVFTLNFVDRMCPSPCWASVLLKRGDISLELTRVRFITVGCHWLILYMGIEHKCKLIVNWIGYGRKYPVTYIEALHKHA
jgi:hypothetical protein